MTEAKRLLCHVQRHVRNYRVLRQGNNRVAVAVAVAVVKAAVKAVRRVVVAASRRASVVAAVGHKAGVAPAAALDQLHRKAVAPAQVHVSVIASGFLVVTEFHLWSLELLYTAFIVLLAYSSSPSPWRFTIG